MPPFVKASLRETRTSFLTIWPGARQSGYLHTRPGLSAGISRLQRCSELGVLQGPGRGWGFQSDSQSVFTLKLREYKGGLGPLPNLKGLHSKLDHTLNRWRGYLTHSAMNKKNKGTEFVGSAPEAAALGWVSTAGATVVSGCTLRLAPYSGHPAQGMRSCCSGSGGEGNGDPPLSPTHLTGWWLEGKREDAACLQK